MKLTKYLIGSMALALLVTPALGGCGAEAEAEDGEDYTEADVGEAPQAVDCSAWLSTRCTTCSGCMGYMSCNMGNLADGCSGPLNTAACWAAAASTAGQMADACFGMPQNNCDPCADNAGRCEPQYRAAIAACRALGQGSEGRSVKDCMTNAKTAYEACISA